MPASQLQILQGPWPFQELHSRPPNTGILLELTKASRVVSSLAASGTECISPQGKQQKNLFTFPSLLVVASQTEIEIQRFFTWAAMWGPELYQQAKKRFWKIIVFQQMTSDVWLSILADYSFCAGSGYQARPRCLPVPGSSRVPVTTMNQRVENNKNVFLRA